MTASLILVIEDNADDVRIMEWAFAKAGVNGSAHFVRNGEGAVDYLLGLPPFEDRSKYPFPDLLLVDLKMPGMDGFQFLDWLRAQSFGDKRPKIALLTGSCQQQDFEHGHALGADFCLSKPTDVRELVVAIKGMVAENN